MTWIRLLLVLLSVVLCPPVLSCPSCMPMAVTLSEELDMAEAVVVARPLGNNRFEVERVLRGRLKAGRVILAATPEDLKLGSKVLLSTVDSEGSPFWTGQPRPGDARVLEFVNKVLQLPQRYAPGGREARLRFFLPYLGHSQSLFADSAYVEFADAPYAQVARFAPQVGLGKLRAWLKNPATPEAHQSLYYIMLGQIGESSDLQWLEPRVLQAAARKPPANLASLLIGYLNLKGTSGLALVEKSFLNGTLERRNAALEALKVLVDEKTRVPRQAVLPLFRVRLKNLDLAGILLRDLALWEDWESLPQVIPLLELPPQHEFTRTSAIRFLRSCPLPLARDTLENLRKKDPKGAERWPPAFVKPAPIR